MDTAPDCSSIKRTESEARMINLVHFFGFIKNNDVGNVEKLLNSDKDLGKESDYDGRTALHVAACHGRKQIAQLLLDCGASVNAPNRWGNSPLADAEGAGHQDVADLLRSHGGHSQGNHTCHQNKELYSPRTQTTDWEMDPHEIDLRTSILIGKGSFGEIRKATWRGTPVAVKSILRSLSQDKLVVQDFRHEVELLVRLRHPNIVQFIGAVTRSEPLMLITEYLSGGDLHKILEEKGSLSAHVATNYALDIARGMSYLHNGEKVIVHRDLKPRNVIRNHANVLKVGDFGLSKLIQHADHHAFYKMTGETGSYRYMAPEVFKHEKYDKSVDVFSFAMIVYEMFEGNAPFSNHPPYDAAKSVADGQRPILKAKTYQPEMKGLIERCWDQSPKKRPLFSGIIVELEKMLEASSKDHHHWPFRHCTP